MVKRRQSVTIRFWVDLHHVCASLGCVAFYFRDCPNSFCLLLTSSTLRSLIFLIPGTFHPKGIVALLSGLPSLRSLSLEFRSPQSRPDSESPSLPPPKPSILPALDEFYFKGVTEYLEELMARIDIPRLDIMNITFFNQIDFDCPRLAQFIDHTPEHRSPDEAQVRFDDITASVTLRYLTSGFDFDELQINISCREPDWQLSSIEQVCNSLPPFSMVEELYIYHGYSQLVWKNYAIENTLWLELFLPFTAVKNLYLYKEFAPGIAVALQEFVGGGTTELLPSLQNIFVEVLEPSEPFQEIIGQFVAARQLSDHPIAISKWTEDSYMEST